jgi:hypothetical protein
MVLAVQSLSFDFASRRSGQALRSIRSPNPSRCGNFHVSGIPETRKWTSFVIARRKLHFSSTSDTLFGFDDLGGGQKSRIPIG